MTIASELIKLQENLTDSYTAVENKGGTLPEHKNFDNLPDAIDSIVQGGTIEPLTITPTDQQQVITASGDVDGYSPITVEAADLVDSVYAENRMGRTPVTGEKVLLTTNTNTSTSYSPAYEQSYYYQPTFVTPQGKAYNFNIYYNHAYPLKYSNGSWIVVDVSGIPFGFDNRRPYININGVRTFCDVNSNNVRRVDYENNYSVLLNNATYWPLNDDIKFKPADGKIYSIDETQSYDTGIGSFSNQNKNVQIFGNTVVVHNNNTVYFVDVTDFPNCSKTSYSLSVSLSISFGITGVDVGSYFIGTASSNLYIYQYNGTGFDQVLVKTILSNVDVFVDLGQKIVCSVDASFYPFGYLLDDTIIEMQIPAAIRNQCHTDVSTSFYNRDRINFATNRVQSIYAWSYSRGDYANYVKASNSVADGVWYISEPQYTNFENVGSFTGFITGEIDQQGNYEVTSVLPEEKTVVLDIDQSADEIEFTGVISYSEE